MTEGEKALKSIRFLLILFVMLFALYLGAFIGVHTRIVKDISAFTQCVDVEDEQFKACYDSKR